jgi:hypothetical protein
MNWTHTNKIFASQLSFLMLLLTTIHISYKKGGVGGGGFTKKNYIAH